ncbi:MAG: nodulation protein NfeD [Bacteroidales bacterium]|nr:nodulation protein NfeD [Bacteroidales bacterium]
MNGILRRNVKRIIGCVTWLCCLFPIAGNNVGDSVKTVYVFDLKDEIGPATWRITQQAFQRATQLNAALIVVHMNTYGGLVDAADSISTKILHFPVPVYVFVDNNAISAGALIAVAADKIYMRTGARMGAATGVNQAGEPMSAKHQSAIRSMMRSLAKAHGMDTVINGKDTVYRWKRDPEIAQAMVGATVGITGVIDSAGVLAMTVDEAIQLGFCEGKVENIQEILALNHIENYTVTHHTLTATEKIIHFLINPYLHGLLVMLIIGGIYFELQTPGIGFPLAVSIIAALLYFAPLYLEGIASHWELALFIVGVLLIGVEIFAFPGFGIAGVSGIIMVVTGISFAMVDNIVFEWDFSAGLRAILKSVCIVAGSAAFALGLSVWLGRYFFGNTALSRVTLQTEQKSSEGYVSFDDLSGLTGAVGIARTTLRPAGKITVNGKMYDAVSEIGYIEQGETVQVIRFETGQLHVIKTHTS